MNEYIVTADSNKINIKNEDESVAIINGRSYKYEITPVGNDTYLLKMNNKVYQLTAGRTGSEIFTIYVQGKQVELIVRSILQENAIRQLESISASKEHKTNIKAPMPGMILKIKKNIGDSVKAGESIIILEAMKMENDIHASVPGIISGIPVQEGNAVEKGALLFIIE
jgi:biotin carboxyl carrier protein